MTVDIRDRITTEIRLTLMGTGAVTLNQVDEHAAPIANGIVDLVINDVWRRALDLYGGQDILDAGHMGCTDGGCNICILEDIARLLEIPDAVIAQVLRRHADAGPVEASAVEPGAEVD